MWAVEMEHLLLNLFGLLFFGGGGDPDYIRSRVWGQSGTFVKVRSPMTWHHSIGHKGPVIRLKCIGSERAQTQLLLYNFYLRNCDVTGRTYALNICIIRHFFPIMLYSPFLWVRAVHISATKK